MRGGGPQSEVRKGLGQGIQIPLNAVRRRTYACRALMTKSARSTSRMARRTARVFTMPAAVRARTGVSDILSGR